VFGDRQAVATYSRLDEGAKVWIEGVTLVGLEKVRVERALAGWGWTSPGYSRNSHRYRCL